MWIAVCLFHFIVLAALQDICFIASIRAYWYFGQAFYDAEVFATSTDISKKGFTPLLYRTNL